ncbi:hypothetical protein Tco_1185418 [Tanacetum coccineum]
MFERELARIQRDWINRSYHNELKDAIEKRFVPNVGYALKYVVNFETTLKEEMVEDLRYFNFLEQEGQKFSPNKNFAVYAKTTPPRSGLTWKPTGRIFTNLGQGALPHARGLKFESPHGKTVGTCLNLNDSAIPLGKEICTPNTIICSNSSSLSAGVTTRGGKTTTHDVQTNNTNVHDEEPLVVNHDKPIELNEVLDKDQPQTSNEPIVQPSSKETARPDIVESEHLYSASANEIDEKKPELKDLLHHLEYAYLHDDKSFPIIISFILSEKEKILLLQVLEKCKGAIAWKMSDIKVISPSYCTHKILIEDDLKPVIQPERRLNPKVQDVMKNEIVKLLDSGLIYPISDSSWDDECASIIVNLMMQLKRMPTKTYKVVHLLQGSTSVYKIQDKKGLKTLGCRTHLSRRHENPDLGTFTEEEIADEFPDTSNDIESRAK